MSTGPITRYGYILHADTVDDIAELLDLNAFLPNEFQVISMVSVPDPLLDEESYEQKVMIGFEPSPRLHELIGMASQLQQIVFHSEILKGYTVEKEPCFLAGFEWDVDRNGEDDEDSEDEDDEDDEDEDEEEDDEEEDEDDDEDDEDDEEDDT